MPKLLVFLLFCLSIALNIYFIFFQEGCGKVADEVAAQGDTITVEEEVGEENEVVQISKTVGPGGFQEVHFPGLGKKQVKAISLSVQSSLTQTICKAISKEDGCELLAAYTDRLINSKFNTASELRKGDRLDLLMEEPSSNPGENNILAIRFQGLKVPHFATYYFRGPGWKYGSYFFEDGTQIFPSFPESEAPIREFSEITSLVGDYRLKNGGHSGIDFKAEVGTPVYAPFPGTVTRINWNFKYNGDCIEIDHPREGIKTVYLHLNKVVVKPGNFVEKGQKIGESGNTGRTFAPHLHYEIRHRKNKDKIMDPFRFKHHNTHHKKIPPEEIKTFHSLVKIYEKLLEM